MINKTHYFITLSPSPWPILSSLSSFNFMLSLLMFFKSGDTSCIFLSFLNLSAVAFSWWTFYSEELCLEGGGSATFESGLKLSMILFISSEIFFFFSFFWAYFHYFLSPMMEVGLNWPPAGFEFFDLLSVPCINTLILMSSGLTITMSHDFLVKGSYENCSGFLMATCVLGGLFTLCQLVEYSNSFFSIGDGSFGSSFFVLTGFHGIHVLIGTLYLMYTLKRFIQMSASKMNSISFEFSSWYWHFVDVVWLFLYYSLYYLPN